MHVQICLPDLPSPAPAFALARLADSRRCPLLAAPLRQAAGSLVGGLPVLPVHRDAAGDLSFGLGAHARAIVGLDLDAQPWTEFDVPDATTSDDLDPGLELAA